MFFTAKIGTGSQIQVSETEVKKVVTDALTKGPGAMVMTTSDGKTMTMPASIPAVVQVPAKVSTTVDVVQVPTKVSTATTTDEKTVFNNIDSQIGTQIADGGPQQTTVDVVQVPTKVSTTTTTTTDEKTVFNNVDSQIGTQIADGGPQQIASQTITSTGAVVQKPVVVPAIPTKPMTMTMNGMTMTMPGMMNIRGPGGITMMRPGMSYMPWTMPGLPGTMTMNGKFWVLLYPFFVTLRAKSCISQY